MNYVEYFSHPNQTVKSLVLWLHGLGDTGEGWLSAVKYLRPNTATHFILPHAPQRPITINGGYIMPGWYDIASNDFRDRGDEEGIRSTTRIIHQFIDDYIEQHQFDSSAIILAGFSQGGAIALQAGLRYSKPLGGILALSTYLPLADTLSNEAAPANTNIPIRMMHGTHDAVIPIKIAEYSYDFLKTHGYKVDWSTYPMGHEACQEELLDINKWLDLRTIA